MSKKYFYTSGKRITKWWPLMQMQQPQLDSWACPTPGLRVVWVLLCVGWWTDETPLCEWFFCGCRDHKIAAQSSIPHLDPLPLGFPDPVIISCGSAFGSFLFQHYSVLAPPVTTVRCVTLKPNSVKNAKNALVLVPFALAFQSTPRGPCRSEAPSSLMWG